MAWHWKPAIFFIACQFGGKGGGGGGVRASSFVFERSYITAFGYFAVTGLLDNWLNPPLSISTNGVRYHLSSYTPYLYRNQPLAPHFELNRPIKNPSTFLGGLALDFLALLLLNIAWIEQLLQFNLRCTLFEFPCIQFKTTRIGDTIFYVSYWRLNHHFTWSSKPREGPAICWAKEVPSFLSCFSWLFWDPGYLVRSQESNPRPSALQSRFLPDWVNPAAVLTL